MCSMWITSHTSLPIDIINPPKKFLIKVSSATQNDCGIVVGFDNLSSLNFDEY
jgi:hypothetical protein